MQTIPDDAIARQKMLLENQTREKIQGRVSKDQTGQQGQGSSAKSSSLTPLKSEDSATR